MNAPISDRFSSLCARVFSLAAAILESKRPWGRGFISTSAHVLFCLLYKHTNEDVFEGFSKISEDFPKLFRLPDERFRTFSKHFPKITEDSRRFLKTTEEDAKMFRSFDKFQCS